MKNVCIICLLLITAVGFSQEKGYHKDGKHHKKTDRMTMAKDMTSEQIATLKVKNMALSLDLTQAQQNEIKPIFIAQAEKRKAMAKARKVGDKPTTDEAFKMKNEALDAKLEMKKKMKTILNKEQFEKFEKQVGRKERMRGKNRMMKRSNN